MPKVEGRAVEGWRRGSEGEGVGRGGWRISSLLTHTVANYKIGYSNKICM